ncbi:MAG: S8 family peptidase [Chitinophagaceae bacterium]|nr:S8 family peptidase [Chitinophagaceae bacterium]
MLVRKICVMLLALILNVNTQAQSPPKNWFQLDPVTDGYFGVSSDKAYDELLKGRTGQPVIVAVIDGGTDINHEDLKANIWTNVNEIPANGIDDDKNGYIDDIHGWNFIGGKTGNVQYDTFELTRLYKMLNDRFGSKNSAAITTAERADYNRYLGIKNDFERLSKEPVYNYQFYKSVKQAITNLLADLGNENPTLEELQAYQPTGDTLMIAQQMLISIMKEGNSVAEIMEELKSEANDVATDALYHYNPDFDPRSIVGDNYGDDTERYYGNADVKGPDATHGTHVAGIIGADRTNAIGINGVADHARLMILRAVPDGDERDKDVANSIRYAADNGAKVINMSFGKAYGYDKKAVDDAVKYAASKDVLLVHASGNDAISNDKNARFPSDQFTDGTTAPNWLEVGASSYGNNVASFSNYGKKNVDVFAPGVAIYATVPGDKYRNLQGTSMASPVAAGVATMLRSYFPQLTAPQVKEIIKQSVVKMEKKVDLPVLPDDKPKMVKLKKISASGGVVNAYNAVQLAIKETSK